MRHLACLFLIGCAARSSEPSMAPQPYTPAAASTSFDSYNPQPTYVTTESSDMELSSMSVEGSLVGDALAAVSGAFASDEKSAAGPPPAPGITAPGEKLVIEAWLLYRVDDLPAAAASIRKLSATLGGKIVSEDLQSQPPSGNFVLRLPPGRVDEAFTGLEEVGVLLQQNIRATDVTKAFRDYQITLENLDKALKRYQEILGAATTVQDILAVEAQLTRVKGDIERLKGELSYLSNRVQLATLTINLTGSPGAAELGPEAKFHPGLRASYLTTWKEGTGQAHYLGAGLSVHLYRWAQFELTLLDQRDDDVVHGDALRIGVTADAYSDFLGGGRNTFLNPYVGLAAGAAWRGTTGYVDVGVNLGLELVKLEALLVDLRLQGSMWLFQGRPVMAFSPSLGFNVAF